MISCIIYFALALSVSFLTNIINLHNKHRWYYIFPILIYTIIVGCRFETGTDWTTYKEIYENVLTNNIFSIEFIYRYFNYILAYLEFSYVWIFLIFAFVQLLLIYNGFYYNKIQSCLTSGIILYFLCGPFMSSMNIMRQSLVFCIFFNSIPLIAERKFKTYILLIILMTGIHISSLLLAPMYFLGYNKIRVGYRIPVIVIFFISLLIGNIIFSKVGNWFFSFIKLDQFARYAINFEDNTFQFGIGVWIYKFIDLGIIWYSYKLKSNNNFNITVIYWIFVIGVIINNIAIGNQIIIRLSYCFISFRFILLAIITNLIYQDKLKRLTVFKNYVYFSWGLVFLSFFTSILKNNNGIYPYKSILDYWL